MLTGCRGKYDHSIEPTNGAILLYIFTLCFFIPFIVLGISFSIRGIRRLKKVPPIASGKKFTIMGGSFLGVGLTLILVFSLFYFPSPLSIPAANKYNTPEKAMKAAVDSARCEFSLAQDYQPHYYSDPEFLLRDAIEDVKNYKTTSNFRKVNQNCDSFHYYVQLNKKTPSVLPFVQLSFFANGYFFIDYVRNQDNGTASFYYKMDEKEAETLVKYAYEVRNRYVAENSKQYDEFIAQKKEEGKIENFFKKAITLDNVRYTVSSSKDIDDSKTVIYLNPFKKEKFEIIADFVYIPLNENPLGNEGRYIDLFQYNYPRPSNDYSIPWQFSLIYTERGNYYVFLNYYYETSNGNYDYVKLYYAMTASQGEGLYDVVNSN